jgi:uncharacterized membrane protein (UPF0182 family)
LKRVIVAIGDQIAMQPTLAESLAAIFGEELPPPEGEEQPAGPEEPPVTPVEPEEPVVSPPGTEEPAPAQSPEEISDVGTLIELAQQHYDKAQQYLQEGNWSGYGKELDALKAVLDRLAELTED